MTTAMRLQQKGILIGEKCGISKGITQGITQGIFRTAIKNES